VIKESYIIFHVAAGRVMELGDGMISTIRSAAFINPMASIITPIAQNFSGLHPEGTPPKGEIAYMISDISSSGGSDVLINGKAENAGTAVASDRNGQVRFDVKQVQKIINGINQGSRRVRLLFCIK
jgi:hypothetical protein